jgi:lipoprotein-anchoring transpeptidase ErfK/SrfK
VSVLGSKRGGAIIAGTGVLALGGAAAFGAVQFMDRAEIVQTTPTANGAVPTHRPVLAVRTENVSRMSDLRVRLDGRDVTARARGDGSRILVPVRGLRDGRHTAEVRFSTSNLFSRTVARTWSFTVDTKRPRLALAKPGPGAVANRHRVRFSGRAEPLSRVKVTWKGASKVAAVRRNGTWTLVARLPEGKVAASVVATDKAGNGTATARGVLVDTSAPRLVIGQPKGGARITTTDEPLFYGRVPNDSPSRLTFGATVNGRAITPVQGASGGGASSPYAQAATTGSTSPTLRIDGHRFALGIGQLPQGTNRITLWVRDLAGNVTKRKLRVGVDSTDSFGTSNMVFGARGADVTALQERLKEAGVYHGATTTRFGPKTLAAVRRYQHKHDLTVDGQVGLGTRRALIGRIVIDLSAYRLSLIRDGKTVMTFPVAVGQSAYPTPTGKWSVVQKQVNPTWLPPSSPWAKGLGSIPPGPGNPLGTRWIGTSAPAVGIHGTPADYSIGTAASHGCIRMHIPDVEKLYDQVEVGTEVDIVP